MVKKVTDYVLTGIITNIFHFFAVFPACLIEGQTQIENARLVADKVS